MRCPWLNEQTERYYLNYHDKEWGRPVFRDQKLFEFFSLKVFQAGVTWKLILKNRGHYREAFHSFNIAEVSSMTDKDIGKLLKNKNILRNKAKISAVINNARKFLEVRKEFGSFRKYLTSIVGEKPIINRIQNPRDIPAENQSSISLSQDLKTRGFKFIGPKSCYSFLQSTGFIIDHHKDCFVYKELQKNHIK